VKVLLILGHPRKQSLCGALAAAYRDGALSAGAEVEEIALADLRFDPHVRLTSPRDQELESDLLRAQALIRWADHLVFVYPTWWGTMPALLKGFLDRALTPGFAFAEREEGGWEQMLGGKSAHLMTTMDTPPAIYRWIFGAPGLGALGKATLGFCGVAPVRVHAFGPVKGASPARRATWLEIAQREGEKLRGGVPRGMERARAWLQALRLQFYPMTWVAYTAGALAAPGAPARGIYWLGYLYLFSVEVATVLANEYFDFGSDRRNRHWGPFNGGSRVLVEGRLGFAEVRAGIAAALLLAAVTAGLLLSRVSVSGGVVAPLLAGLVLGLGYTTPPLRLAYRGLGELTVGVTHSVLVLLCGYVLQGGAWYSPFPWLLSVPLFFAVLPSILLAGIPDSEADRAVRKKTMAVRLGARRAAVLAMICTLLAAVAAAVLCRIGPIRAVLGGALPFIVPHAALLLGLLYRYARRERRPARLDGLLIAALSYMVWFAVIPLLHLRAGGRG
jgi:1,4-dihydroxy-2-naphthoate octaprenyltransferase